MALSIELAGKKALVTGASRGIGRGIALALARAGADVAVNFVRSRRAADAVVEEIAALGRRSFAVRANVGEPDAVDRLFDEVAAQMGGLDILVSNAASGVLRPAVEVDKHHWQWTLDTNAWAFLDLARHAVPLMRGRGGSIVAISSLGAVRALPYYALVGASKAALEALVRHLARELGPEGVRVNAVAAGAVDTDALRHFPNREELLERFGRGSPLGRLCTPDDVAGAVVFLCSELAGFVHGHTLVLDGGYSILG